VAWTGPRHTFYHARKSFWNARFADRALIEVDEDERLDVLIRSPQGGSPRDQDLNAELDLWNGINAFWFPEPLDVIPPSEPGGAPLLVLSDPGGIPLSARPRPQWRDAGPWLRLARELLEMLDVVHQHGLTASALDPADIVVDDLGNWTYLGTDRIAPGSSEASRDDLGRWARLTGCMLMSLHLDPAGAVPRWDRSSELRLEPPRGADGPRSDAFAWLAARVGPCLASHPEDRPRSAAELLSPAWKANPD
jgi:hypothetical protein